MKTLNKIVIHSLKYSWKWVLAASAVDAIAVIQFSLTIEQPVLIKEKSLNKVYFK